jgi:hypothetical protein
MVKSDLDISRHDVFDISIRKANMDLGRRGRREKSKHLFVLVKSVLYFME